MKRAEPEPQVNRQWLLYADFALQPSRMASCARRDGDIWTFPPTIVPVMGPCHPSIHKSAVATVNSRNSLSLVFASIFNVDSSFDEISVQLEAADHSGCDITHASFAAEAGGTLLLATVDENLVARIYRVVINWNYPYLERQVPPRTFRLQPKLEVSRLKSLQLSVYVYQDALASQLYDLRILPAVTDDLTGSVVAHETLLVCFAGVDRQSMMHPATRIVRLALYQEIEELHGSFAQVATRNNVSANNTLVRQVHLDGNLPLIECSTPVTEHLDWKTSSFPGSYWNGQHFDTRMRSLWQKAMAWLSSSIVSQCYLCFVKLGLAYYAPFLTPDFISTA